MFKALLDQVLGSTSVRSSTYDPSLRYFREWVSLRIFVTGHLGFGLRSTFILFRTDSNGKEVPRKFIDSSSDLNPGHKKLSDFVKLMPNHFLGVTYRSSIRLLNLQRPGRYNLWIEYYPSLLASEVEVRPFWGRERGPLKSNVVQINVVP